MARTTKFNAAVQEALRKIGSPTNMKKFGETAADIVRLRTRLGFGVSDDNAEKARLKPLSKSYKDFRKGKIAFFTTPDGRVVPYKPNSAPTLHPDTSPTKSNLTFTGQMLDSLGVVSVRQGEALIGPRGNRTKSPLSNKQVAKYVTAQGRAFNNLSKVENKRMAEAIAEALNAQLKIELTK